MKLPILFSFVASASAHVKLLNTGFPIRNANNANGDGRFSVADPCGGAATFGSNGVTEVFEDSTIELKLAYNGGHKSSTRNWLSVAYKCGEVGKFPPVFASVPGEGQASQFLQHAEAFEAAGGKVLPTVISPNVYPVDATQSLVAGYTLSFKVPPAMDDESKCTITVTDFRNWGGCIDVDIKPKPTSGGPPVIPQKNLEGISLLQAYDISDVNYELKLESPCDAGNCVCKDTDKCLMKDSQDKCWKCGKGDNLECICNIDPNMVSGSGENVGMWSHSGTCKHDSPGCACIDGTIKVVHQTSSGSGTAMLNLQGKPYTGQYKDMTFSVSAEIPIQQQLQSLVTPDTGATLTFKTSNGMTIPQTVRIQTTPGNADASKVYVSFSVVDDVPVFCGLEMTVNHDKYRVSQYEAGGQDNDAQGIPEAASSALSSSANVAVAVFALLLAIFG